MNPRAGAWARWGAKLSGLGVMALLVSGLLAVRRGVGPAPTPVGSGPGSASSLFPSARRDAAPRQPDPQAARREAEAARDEGALVPMIPAAGSPEAGGAPRPGSSPSGVFGIAPAAPQAPPEPAEGGPLAPPSAAPAEAAAPAPAAPAAEPRRYTVYGGAAQRRSMTRSRGPVLNAAGGLARPGGLDRTGHPSGFRAEDAEAAKRRAGAAMEDAKRTVAAAGLPPAIGGEVLATLDKASGKTRPDGAWVQASTSAAKALVVPPPTTPTPR